MDGRVERPAELGRSFDEKLGRDTASVRANHTSTGETPVSQQSTIMDFTREHAQLITRRHFFRRCNSGIGALALASLMGENLFAGATTQPDRQASASRS